MSLLSILKLKTTVAPAKQDPALRDKPVADLAQIQSTAREIILEAKDEAIRIKDQAVRDARERLSEIEAQAKSLTQKQQELTRQDELLNRARIGLEEEGKQAEKLKGDLLVKQEELVKKLEKIASLTTDEARDLLLTEIRKKSTAQIAKAIKEAEDRKSV